MIVCPTCGCPTGVLETRDTGPHVRRRRVCENVACNKKITTVEMIISTGSRGLQTGNKIGNDLILVHRSDIEKISALTARTLAAARAFPNESTEETEGTAT